MLFNVYHHTTQELRKPIFIWFLTMLGLAVLAMLAFPIFNVNMDLNWLSNQNSASMLFGDGPGPLILTNMGNWLGAVGFGLLFPLAMAIMASMLGSWLVAGEEERGSLGLLLAAGLPRFRFMIEKSAVLLAAILRAVIGLGVLLWLVSWFGVKIAGLWNLLAGLFLFGLFFGAQALALGSVSGRKRFSLAISMLGLLLAFVFSRLPTTLAASKILRLLSPLTYYEVGAVNGWYLLILLVFSLAFFVLAWMQFERRDLEI